ncbi:MAG: hypothetical protein ACKOA6_04935, partial [Actinomycetota bacterium]
QENPDHDKKDVPLIPPRVVSINQGFFDLPHAERRALLMNLIDSLNTDEEVRKRAREQVERWRNQA